MRDLDKALADIVLIRNQIAAGTTFRGYGPMALAATGVLALITATAQTLWFADANEQPLVFLAGWVITALVAIGIIGAEMLGRSRRLHSGLADVMIYNAIQQFLPSGAVGALLAAVLIKFAPQEIWMLPGLWQVLVSVGIFASVHALPRGIAFAGAWYLLSGLTVLALASQDHLLSTWHMGIPFAGGQFLTAAIMYYAFGKSDDEDQY
ncbi:MAG: hypothetical protein P8Y67_09900 [Alphaproteobacteria bacterium]